MRPTCPRISADNLTYTIPLRDGVTFHNGRPVVAEDYAYAWDRVLDPANESWAASYIYTIEGAKERYEDGAKTVTGIKVIDPKTIQVTLVQPDVTFLYALTQPFMAPVPKEEVDKYGEDFQAHVVGNGPYKLTTYDPGGQTMMFDRHTDYHWAGLPYVDQVEYLWGVDAGVQILELSKGDADVLADGLDAQNLAKMRRDPKQKENVFEQPLLAQRWVNLDQSRQPLFKDIKVRQALNYATDRDALSKVTGDTAFTFGAPFPKRTCRASRARSSRSRTTRRRRRPCWPRPASRNPRSTSGWRPTRPTRRSSGRSCSSSGQPSASTRRSAARRTPTRSTS